MSDSFADLWSSSAPVPPKQKPQTLSSATSSRSNTTSSTVNLGSKPDVFALLSSSGTSTPAARYGNGSSYTTTSSSSSATFSRTTPRPSNPPSRTLTPSMSSQPIQGSSTATGTRSDAFSDLFATSNGTTTSNSTMTLAARLAMEAEQRGSRTSSPGMQKTPSSGTHQANDAAWAGLDSLGGGMPSIPATVSKPNISSSRAQTVDEEDDWGLGDFGKPISANANIDPTPVAHQPKPRTQTTAQSIAQAAEKKKGVSLWDMDEFSGAHTSSSSTQQTTQHHHPSTSQRKPAFEKLFDGNDGDHVDSPDVDFDFGSREDRDASNKRGHRHKGGLLDFEDHGDHDYGRGSGMERGLLDDGDQDGDDLLGMLGRPVQVVRTQRERDSEGMSTPRTRSTHDDTNKPSRTVSPPPHLLGQIVEMGFSVTEAKRALAATTGGQDVQAALESLLNGSGDTAERPSQPERHPQHTSPPPPPVATRTRGAPKGQKERERERLERQRQQLQQQQQGGESGGFVDMQEQADRLLAQASEIGSSVFSKASAFWKEGKEKVVKAYEERTTGERAPGRGPANGQGGGGGGGSNGGRPKWMQEVVHPSDDEDTYERETSAFKDENDQGPSITSHPNPVSSQQQQRRKAALEVHEQEVDLFAVNHEPQPQSHRNPSPHPRPHPVRQASSSSSMRSSPSQSQSSTSRAAPPVPVPTRNLISASPSALSLAQKHKTAGTEQFKLGQHGPAAESYSSAISALPAGHLLLVPLHTNRALTRLKTGEYVGAIEDCERAVEGIVGKHLFSNEGNTSASSSSYGIEDPLAQASKSGKALIIPPPLLDASSIPASLITAGRSRANGGGWTHPQGIGVDMLDSYTKALRRAAEAFEGREKWVEACAWWGVLSRAGEGEGAGWVDEKARKEAIAGGVRCRKMVDGNGSSAVSGSQNGVSSTARPPPPVSRPKPNMKTPRPAPSSNPKSTAPSKALQSLQSNNAQAEADDNAKYALKDTVDARLLAWKAGKETNIRALLASLDTVLWEGASGIQGLKMGMADLVSGGQVKKGYVKAISRVHPDKLNAGNSTVEQRMLANGVFAGLNEAWIAFQATQK